jgi:hypothetical protein
MQERSRAAIITIAPSRAYASEIAFPIPFAPPVMIATLFLSLIAVTSTNSIEPLPPSSKKRSHLSIVYLEESPSLFLIVSPVFFSQLWLLYFAGGAARYLVKDDGARTQKGEGLLGALPLLEITGA